MPFPRTPPVRDPADLHERDVRDFISRLSDVGLLHGAAVSVDLTTSATRVPHSLGRVPTGFFVTDKNAQADVWRTADSTDQALTLQASADVSVTLWVF